jgi:hypothetical protein
LHPQKAAGMAPLSGRLFAASQDKDVCHAPGQLSDGDCTLGWSYPEKGLGKPNTYVAETAYPVLPHDVRRMSSTMTAFGVPLHHEGIFVDGLTSEMAERGWATLNRPPYAVATLPNRLSTALIPANLCLGLASTMQGLYTLLGAQDRQRPGSPHEATIYYSARLGASRTT